LAALLEVQDVHLSFGGVSALGGVSLRIEEGETVALIGPNGSGKTSLFNCVTGFYRPDRGAIVFAGQSLLGCPPDEVARRRIARTFQNPRLFPRLPVVDNLMVGRHLHFRRRFVDALLGRRAEESRQRRECEELLERLDLRAWGEVAAGDCPYGIQKRVELARALATTPRLLLLDEPASGLSAPEREDLGVLIRAAREGLGLTLLRVEHDLAFAAHLATRMVALDEGAVIAEGTPSAVQSHPDVARAYLGREARA
jgi:branched-chain amino acid transport system ATP-binding protein